MADDPNKKINETVEKTIQEQETKVEVYFPGTLNFFRVQSKNEKRFGDKLKPEAAKFGCTAEKNVISIKGAPPTGEPPKDGGLSSTLTVAGLKRIVSVSFKKMYNAGSSPALAENNLIIKARVGGILGISGKELPNDSFVVSHANPETHLLKVNVLQKKVSGEIEVRYEYSSGDKPIALPGNHDPQILLYLSKLLKIANKKMTVRQLKNLTYKILKKTDKDFANAYPLDTYKTASVAHVVNKKVIPLTDGNKDVNKRNVPMFYPENSFLLVTNKKYNPAGTDIISEENLKVADTRTIQDTTEDSFFSFGKKPTPQTQPQSQTVQPKPIETKDPNNTHTAAEGKSKTDPIDTGSGKPNEPNTPIEGNKPPQKKDPKLDEHESETGSTSEPSGENPTDSKDNKPLPKRKIFINLTADQIIKKVGPIGEKFYAFVDNTDSSLDNKDLRKILKILEAQPEQYLDEELINEIKNAKSTKDLREKVVELLQNIVRLICVKVKMYNSKGSYGKLPFVICYYLSLAKNIKIKYVESLKNLLEVLNIDATSLNFDELKDEDITENNEKIKAFVDEIKEELAYCAGLMDVNKVKLQIGDKVLMLDKSTEKEPKCKGTQSDISVEDIEEIPKDPDENSEGGGEVMEGGVLGSGADLGAGKGSDTEPPKDTPQPPPGGAPANPPQPTPGGPPQPAVTPPAGNPPVIPPTGPKATTPPKPASTPPSGAYEFISKTIGDIVLQPAHIQTVADFKVLTGLVISPVASHKVVGNSEDPIDLTNSMNKGTYNRIIAELGRIAGFLGLSNLTYKFGDQDVNIPVNTTDQPTKGLVGSDAGGAYARGCKGTPFTPSPNPGATTTTTTSSAGASSPSGGAAGAPHIVSAGASGSAGAVSSGAAGAPHIVSAGASGSAGAVSSVPLTGAPSGPGGGAEASAPAVSGPSVPEIHTGPDSPPNDNPPAGGPGTAPKKVLTPQEVDLASDAAKITGAAAKSKPKEYEESVVGLKELINELENCVTISDETCYGKSINSDVAKFITLRNLAVSSTTDPPDGKNWKDTIAETKALVSKLRIRMEDEIKANKDKICIKLGGSIKIAGYRDIMFLNQLPNDLKGPTTAKGMIASVGSPSAFVRVSFEGLNPTVDTGQNYESIYEVVKYRKLVHTNTKPDMRLYEEDDNLNWDTLYTAITTQSTSSFMHILYSKKLSASTLQSMLLGAANANVPRCNTIMKLLNNQYFKIVFDPSMPSLSSILNDMKLIKAK